MITTSTFTTTTTPTLTTITSITTTIALMFKVVTLSICRADGSLEGSLESRQTCKGRQQKDWSEKFCG